MGLKRSDAEVCTVTTVTVAKTRNVEQAHEGIGSKRRIINGHFYQMEINVGKQEPFSLESGSITCTVKGKVLLFLLAFLYV